MIFLLIAGTFFTTQADAAFVSYKDTSGKIHYINTEYTKVPDQYLSQVEDQLKKIEADKTKNNFINIPDQNINAPIGWMPNNIQSQEAENIAKVVEVFYKTDCEECMRLRVRLDANKINYSLYDVENSSPGMEFYKTLPNTQLPITRIGKTIIYGNDINAIKNVLTPEIPVVQNPPPTQTPTITTTPEQNLPTSAPATSGYGGYTPGKYFKINPLLGNK